MQTTVQNNSSMEEIFGAPVCSYSRAQAIEDGQLVDVSEGLKPCPFQYPVAMTIGAYSATIAAGGRWVSQGDGTEELELPPGQDCPGRLHDVFTMMLWQIKRTPRGENRVDFSVLVDVNGNGQKKKVDLYSLCGPGDTAAPVLTIMLPNED